LNERKFNSKIYTVQLGGRELSVEIGKLAELANGSCLLKYGDTVVLVTATASGKVREGIDYFPLSVDFEERLYAVGRIPGSFMRREGRPSERAVLASRLIDRPMRPLFPSDMRNDVSVMATILSVESDNSPEIVAMIGASIAVAISDIPWNGPIAGVHMGLVDGKLIVNPSAAEREASDLNLTVAGSEKKVVMIEAGAREVPEDTMLNAITAAHEEIKNLCAFIGALRRKSL